MTTTPTTEDPTAAKIALARRLEEFQDDLPADEQAALTVLLARGTGMYDLLQLASTPAEEILDEDEREVVRLLDETEIAGPGLPAAVAVVTKSTRLCNLRCTYCNAWAEGPDQQMTFEVLARLVHGLLRSPGTADVTFVWHGGEPTLRSNDFYLKALWLQQRWRRDGQAVHNTLQTNGTRVTPEFIELCRRLNISVSVSLDGPPEIHDSQRRDAAGRPTSDRVREGIRRLREADMCAGVLMVVDDRTVDLGARQVLDHLLELDVGRVGLLNAYPGFDDDGAVSRTDPWLPWGRWLRFLRDLYPLWLEVADRLVIREFVELSAIARGGATRTCYFSDDCFSYAFTVEPDGRVGPCDKFVGSGLEWGSILELPVPEVLTSAGVQAQRALDARESGANDCRWSEACHGSCPHDRMVNAARGAGVPDGCCGFGPLLDDIEAVLAGESGSDRVRSVFGHADASVVRAGVPVRLAPRRDTSKAQPIPSKETRP